MEDVTCTPKFPLGTLSKEMTLQCNAMKPSRKDLSSGSRGGFCILVLSILLVRVLLQTELKAGYHEKMVVVHLISLCRYSTDKQSALNLF